MCIAYEKGLYVRIEQLEKGPHPKPLEHGFSRDKEYRVLGIYNPSESGECWLVLSNDRDEMWYISQRHVRTSALREGDTAFRSPLVRLSLAPQCELGGQGRYASGAA